MSLHHTCKMQHLGECELMPIGRQILCQRTAIQQNLRRGPIGSMVDIGRCAGMGRATSEASGEPSGVVGAGSGMGFAPYPKWGVLAG